MISFSTSIHIKGKSFNDAKEFIVLILEPFLPAAGIISENKLWHVLPESFFQ